MRNVHMHSRLFARKEKESEAAFPKNGRCHALTVLTLFWISSITQPPPHNPTPPACRDTHGLLTFGLLLYKHTVLTAMQAALHTPLRSTRLLDQLRERIRYCHYSLRTEQAYVYW